MNKEQKSMDALLTEKIREIVRSEMKAFMDEALQDLQTELVKAIEENLQTEFIKALKETLQTAKADEVQTENEAHKFTKKIGRAPYS